MGVEVTDRAGLLPRRGRASRARLAAAAERLLAATDRATGQLSVVVVGDRAMRTLNRSYRGRDKTTDVLAFSQIEGAPVLTGEDDSEALGDVVIALPAARRQARAGGWTLEEELLRLLVHGVLHLLGYDHEKSRREAARMRRAELRLCGVLAAAGYACAREDAGA